MHAPHAKHINQMLLSKIVLLVDVSLERGKYIPLLHQVFATLPLQTQQYVVRDAVLVGRRVTLLRWDREVFQLLT